MELTMLSDDITSSLGHASARVEISETAKLTFPNDSNPSEHLGKVVDLNLNRLAFVVGKPFASCRD